MRTTADTIGLLRDQRLRLTIALLAGLALALTPLSATPASADDRPATWTQAEDQMIDLINDARSEEGLSDLHLDRDVRAVARDWAETMSVDGFEHHAGFEALYPSGWTSAGENIGRSGMHDTLEITTRSLHRAFMDSPGHRDNILRDGFTHVGVGFHVDDSDGVWVTVNFMGHPDRAAAAESDSDDDADPVEEALSFLDITGSVHADAIERMTDAGVISGYEDGTFRPGNGLTRAQLATLLVRQLGLERDGDAPGFSDVASNHPHADNIRIVASHEVVGGYEDGTFRPERSLTRAQAATMLVRAFEVADSGADHGFSDVAATNVHAEAIAAAAEHGMVGGYEDGTFRPGSGLTRGQIATILDRMT